MHRRSFINGSVPVAATNSDFFLLTIPLTFAPGSADSAEVCTTLSATVDNIVEEDESFTVTLTLATPGPSLSIENNITTVAILDGDRMLP